MRHLHALFALVLLGLILAVLLSPKAGQGSGDAAAVAPLERTYDMPVTQGTECCSWKDGANTRHCVAAAGQSCDICAAVC